MQDEIMMAPDTPNIWHRDITIQTQQPEGKVERPCKNSELYVERFKVRSSSGLLKLDKQLMTCLQMLSLQHRQKRLNATQLETSQGFLPTFSANFYIRSKVSTLSSINIDQWQLSSLWFLARPTRIREYWESLQPRRHSPVVPLALTCIVSWFPT